MKKLLIAVSSAALSAYLQQVLSGEFYVATCDNGEETVACLRELEPDILLLDLMIGGMDGLSIVKILRDSGMQTQVVAITPVCSDYVVTNAQYLNVAKLIRVPAQVDHIAASVMDVAHWQMQQPSQIRSIHQTLAALGFRLNASGYDRITTAVQLLAEDPRQPITTVLYHRVAAQCNSSSSQVEKAIRSAVESAWKSRNEAVWRMYFPVGQQQMVRKPTNAEFLLRMVQCVAGEEKEQSCPVQQMLG